MTQFNVKKLLIFCLLPLLTAFMASCSCSDQTVKRNPDLYLEINVKPLDEAQKSFSKQELASIKAVMEKRIEFLGAYANTITIQDQTLKIEIVGYTDLEEVKAVLGKPGRLTFTDDQGSIIVTGDHVKKVTYSKQGMMEGNIQEPIIKLEFDEEGKRLFAISTKKNRGRQISINLDEEPIMSPVVHDAIENGIVILTFGSSSVEKTKIVQQTAALLKGGVIPALISIVKAEAR